MTATFIELGGKGRLGNAMFQLAATVGYAKKHNVPFIFPKWQHQNDFIISNDFFIPKQAIKYNSTYNEPNFLYRDIPFKPNQNISGYFQSWKYWEHCQDYIREIFTPREPEYSEMFEGICAIHVRRGDYLKFADYHPTQTMEYYKNAMESIPCERFLIFSDDIEWCKENFKDKNCIVSDAASPSVDFNCMRLCSHFIIANSSFSWWAAWLSINENKVVVAPKNWFGIKLSETHPTTDLILPNWIIL